MLSEDKSTIEPFVCQCTLSSLIQTNRSKLAIKRTEQKVTEKSSYTLYIITFDSLETKRRYSEFESFRNTLTKLYPAIFVPPIPGKHSISDYAHVHPQNRQKDERALIEKRKRMLTRFLDRLLEHPILSKEHVLHQFLQPELIWSDLVSRPPLSTLKNPFSELPTANVSSDYAHSFVSSIPGSSSITQAIPIPSVSYSLKDPDPKYTKTESFINNQVQHTFIRFDRSQKKVLRRLGDLSNDYSEIGAAYNALSLEEVGVMANIIERLGISNDQTCTEMRKLVSQLEIDFSEHVQEYVQYISIAKQSNRYWYMKQIQLEMIGEALITKQTTLQTLLKTEGDAERLQATMTSSTSSSISTTTTKQSNNNNNNNNNIDINDQHDKLNNDTNSIDFDTHSIEDGFATIDASSIPSNENGQGDHDIIDDEDHYPSGASVSAIRASKSRSKKWSSPRKLLNAMTYTIQEMIDVDPALTRRNQIGKLKETIWQLELAKQKTQEEAKKIGETIQEEFERLEKLKSTELKRMIIQFAKLQLQFCEKSMTSWQETRKEVDNMSIVND